jgi:hypothetical protein
METPEKEIANGSKPDRKYKQMTISIESINYDEVNCEP